MNTILTMSSFIFPLITFPYVSRILLPAGTGRVSFATSIITYFNMFAQLGIPTYGVRECAKIRDNRRELSRLSQELLLINLIMCVFSYVALFISIAIIPRFREQRSLLIIISSTIFLSAIGMEWLYKALEEYTYITIRSVIFKFIALIAMFLLIHKKSDYLIYGAISVLASSASNVFNLINVHKFIDLKPVGNYRWKRHIKPIIIFFAMSCATTIYTNLDTVMLGLMKTDEDVGYYNAAVKIKNVLVSAVTSLGTVLLPRSSYYVEHNEYKQFERICNKALNFVFAFALPLIIYFILFAKESVLFLSGPSYEGAIKPMQILMPTLLFIGITNILGIQILVPTGREIVVLQSEVAGALTDLFLNVLLIPGFKSSGAAVGTLVAEFVVLIVQYRVLKSVVSSVLSEIEYWKMIVGIIFACLGCLWVKHLSCGNFLQLLISASIYFVVYGVVMVIARETLSMEIFHQLLSKVHRK